MAGLGTLLRLRHQVLRHRLAELRRQSLLKIVVVSVFLNNGAPACRQIIELDQRGRQLLVPFGRCAFVVLL